jgi:type II secretory pathway pseudopilin PulG
MVYNPYIGTRGVTVVEVMVSLFIMLLVFTFVGQTFTLFFRAQERALQHTQALFFAEEGIEILKYIRDDDWMEIDSRTVGTRYYLSVASTTVGITTTPEVIDGRYTRSFILRSGYRSASNDLVPSTASGASIDGDTYIVESYVAWGSGEEVELQSILTNIHDI